MKFIVFVLILGLSVPLRAEDDRETVVTVLCTSTEEPGKVLYKVNDELKTGLFLKSGTPYPEELSIKKLLQRNVSEKEQKDIVDYKKLACGENPQVPIALRQQKDHFVLGQKGYFFLENEKQGSHSKIMFQKSGSTKPSVVCSVTYDDYKFVGDPDRQYATSIKSIEMLRSHGADYFYVVLRRQFHAVGLNTEEALYVFKR